MTYFPAWITRKVKYDQSRNANLRVISVIVNKHLFYIFWIRIVHDKISIPINCSVIYSTFISPLRVRGRLKKIIWFLLIYHLLHVIIKFQFLIKYWKIKTVKINTHGNKFVYVQLTSILLIYYTLFIECHNWKRKLCGSSGNRGFWSATDAVNCKRLQIFWYLILSAVIYWKLWTKNC